MIKFNEYSNIVHNRNALVNSLVRIGIFSMIITCPSCNSEIKLNLDALHYRCTATCVVRRSKRKPIRRICNFYKSARKNTFFEGILGIQKMAMFVGYFLELPHPKFYFIQRELNMSFEAVSDWSNYCREVCMKWTERNITKLGGEGKIVEIDEAKFGKRKYNRGRLVEGQWVFGGIERGTKKVFLVPVENRSAETLIDLIKTWIHPGTTVISDCWKAYDRLDHEGFHHLTVNHSLNFVDPETGANTQSVERLWRDVRSGIPRYGPRKKYFDGYLAEFLFKRYVRPGERIEAFYEITKHMYQ